MKPELPDAVRGAYVSVFSARVKPDRIDRFLSALEWVLPLSAQEDGILRFEVFRSRSDPLAFTIVDLYRDEAGYESHTQTPHIARLSKELEGCFDVGPSMEIFDVHDGIPLKA